MLCEKCGFDNPKGAKFCLNCGSPLYVKCSVCGALNPPGAKFCGECGAKLDNAKSVEERVGSAATLKGLRRKVAVVFADVSGFTALSERLDPEEVTSIINALYEELGEVIASYDGYVDKYIGDCVMVLFGAPQAHEDDVLRAVLSALSMMQKVKEFNKKNGIDLGLSIGINFGEVVAGQVGSKIKMQYTVMGDSVNLAQRLQSKAPRGKIFVSESVFKLTRKEIEYETIGSIFVKGKKEPVNVFSPKAAKSSQYLRRVALYPMVGRKKESLVLLKTFRSLKPHEGRVVRLTGEGGIGKSKLVFEFLRGVPGGNVDIIQLEGIEYLMYAEGRLFKEFVKRVIGINEEDSPEVLREKVDEFFKRYGTEYDFMVTLLKDVLGVPVEDKRRLMFQDMRDTDKLHVLIRGVIERLKFGDKEYPYIFIIDDWQWVDDLSKRFFMELARNMSSIYGLFLMVSRESEVLPGGDEHNFIDIHLQPLSVKEVKKMIQIHLNAEAVDDRILKIILEKCNGNPFYVEEFVQMLKNKGVVSIKNGKAILMKDVSSIPVKIEEMLLVKLDSLNENERQVVNAAAVIGPVFDAHLLYKIFQSGANIDGILKSLEGKKVVRRLSGALSEIFEERFKYAFVSELFRKVSYDVLLKKDRKALHRKVAEAAESLYSDSLREHYEFIAYHYKKSGAEERYLEYLLKLAMEYKRKGFYREAEGKLEQYVKSKKNGVKAAVLLELSECKIALGKYEESFRLLDRLYDIFLKKGLKQEAVKILILKAEAMSRYGRFEHAIKIIDGLEDETRSIGDKELLIKYYNTLGNIYWGLAKVGKARECFVKSLGLCREVYGENKVETARVLSFLAGVYSNTNNLNLALKYYKKSADIVRRNLGEFHPYLAELYTGMSNVYSDLNDIKNGLTFQKKALKIRLRVFGERNPSIAVDLHNIGNFYKSMGKMKKALSFYQRALEIRKEFFGELNPLIVVTRHGIFKCYDNLGYKKKALEIALENYDVCTKVLEEMHPISAIVIRDLGLAYFKIGEYEKSIPFFERTLRICEEFGEESCFDNMTELGRVYVKAGDFVKARGIFEESLSLMSDSEEQKSRYYVIANLGMAEVERYYGNMEKALDFAKEALRVSSVYGYDSLKEEAEKLLKDMVN